MGEYVQKSGLRRRKRGLKELFRQKSKSRIGLKVKRSQDQRKVAKLGPFGQKDKEQKQKVSSFYLLILKVIKI
jgi:hypothetical protein